MIYDLGKQHQRQKGDQDITNMVFDLDASSQNNNMMTMSNRTAT